MAALFPRWSNTVVRVALAASASGALALVVAPMIYVRTPYRRGQYEPADQPVEFDHRHHVRDAAIDCRYCHAGAERGPYAGVPATEICMGCHAQVWTKSPMLEPVRRSWFSGKPIPWNRVHDLPDHVYFNHAVHVQKGVGCVECHGRVDQMARVEQVASLTMGFCLDCHRDPERHLRPPDRVTDMEWAPEGDPAAVGARIAASIGGVRHLTNCSACHR